MKRMYVRSPRGMARVLDVYQGGTVYVVNVHWDFCCHLVALSWSHKDGWQVWAILNGKNEASHA